MDGLYDQQVPFMAPESVSSTLYMIPDPPCPAPPEPPDADRTPPCL